MRQLNVVRWAVQLVLLAGAYVPAWPADSSHDVAERIEYQRYPSMIPVNAVRVHLLNDPRIVEWLMSQPEGECLPASAFKLTDKGSNTKVAIERVGYGRDPLNPERRDCALAVLVVSAEIVHVQKLHLEIDLPGKAPVGWDLTIPSGKGVADYTLAFTPQAAPGESLTNGASRDVGQLNVNVAVPEMLRGFHSARTYFGSTDLLSTDGKDKKSAFEADLGLERSALNRWYVPTHVQAQTKGNQRATNLSFLLGLGSQTVIPWSWTSPVLYTKALQVPISPTLNLNAQYERRLRQDATSAKKFPNKNDAQLNPSLSWRLIALLPGVLKSATTPGVELNLGAWYLPLDRTTGGSGSQRFEGYGDVSLLVPLPLLQQFVPGAGFLTSSDPKSTKIRIKWADAVNSASGFARTRQWTYGLEVTK